MSDVAKTIFAQLGGKRFVAMTGASRFVGGPTGLMFSLPPGARNKARMIHVDYTPMDTYNVLFYTLGGKLIEKVEDVYCDTLQSVFTGRTGLYTSLGTMGR